MGDNPSKPEPLETNIKPQNYSLEDCAKCVKVFSAAKGVNFQTNHIPFHF